MQIYGLRINGLENPIGYEYRHLLCSWKVKDAVGRQNKVIIEVSLDTAFTKIVYTKEGVDLNSVGENIDFSLVPYTRYYYRVTVHGSEGDVATSPTAYFETAKLDEPWVGRWIGIEDDKEPEFHKLLTLQKEIARARLYITGLGLFECYMNGIKVGNDVLAPFLNDYDTGVQYCTYDVTDLLKDSNDIRIFLGRGWYKGRFGLGGPVRRDRKFAFIAELRVEYADGSSEIIGTDENWRYRDSVFVFTDIYDGEIQQFAKNEQENRWKKAILIESPHKLVQRQSCPLMEMEDISVKELIHTPSGEWVLDFGQNFAGYVECTQMVPEGRTMTWEFGEILQNGNFYKENYRTAKSTFCYISDGEKRVIKPHFTFFGFRYVKISGLEKIYPDCFVGKAVYSKMEQTGYLYTGNNKINQLFSNSLWGLKSNFLDMPTDCPQRDERLAWTGDAQVFAPTASFHMDTRAFYRKFLRELREDQNRNNGAVAIFMPNHFAGLYAAVWSDVATFLPKILYDYYGSKEDLQEFFPLMKDWVDFIHSEDKKRGQKNLYNFGFQFGDWLALDGATEQSTFGRTENEYVASMYYYASTMYVAQAADILELEEKIIYQQRAKKIRDALVEEYFTASGRLAIDTQTGYLLALKFGVYIDRQKIIEGLRNRLKKDCYRIKGGFVGATMMNIVMAENGLLDMAYDLLLYEGYPSWLYAVNLGATTIWERWNSVLPDGSISGTGMNSLNHYSYGSVVEFIYRYGMGIRPLEPGFKRVRIEPNPEIRLEFLEGQYESVSGCYVSNWYIEKGRKLRFHIEIPFGCEAEVVLPEQDCIVLGAGCYDFAYETKKDYRAPYSEKTPISRLWEDKRVVDLFEKYLPGYIQNVDRNDIEAMSKSMVEIKYRATLFRTPTEKYDKLVEELKKIRM